MPTVDKDQAAALRRKYGLANNASHEDILAAVLADEQAAPVVTRPADTKPGTDDSGTLEERREEQAEEFQTNQENVTGNPMLSEKKETPAAPAAPVAPTVDTAALAEEFKGQYVSASAFAAFQAEHEQVKSALAAREAAETKARRDGLVTEWFRAGKIGPDEVKKVREGLDTNEELVTDMVGSRAPMFSTREVGHAKLDPEFMAMDTDATLESAQFDADDAIFGKTTK